MNQSDASRKGEFKSKLLQDWRSLNRRQQDRLYEQLRDFSKSFDQTMISLAAGAIAGSVVFLEKVDPDGRAFVIVSWVLLAASLGCILVSYHLAVGTLARHLRAIEEEEAVIIRKELTLLREDYGISRREATDDSVEATATQPSTSPSLFLWLDRTAIALLMAGVVFLLAAAFHVTAA